MRGDIWCSVHDGTAATSAMRLGYLYMPLTLATSQRKRRIPQEVRAYGHQHVCNAIIAFVCAAICGRSPDGRSNDSDPTKGPAHA